MPAPIPPLDSTQEFRDFVNFWIRNDATPSFLGLRMNTALISLADFIDTVIVTGGGEPTIAAGTVNQYWRGDKTWQTLNKAAVGLPLVQNVDQTVASNLTSGTIPAGRYGAMTVPISAINASGTPDSSTVLFGDGTWGTPVITDGTYGIITVSGTDWNLVDGSVTFSKLPNISQWRVVGRIDPGSGPMTELTGSQVTSFLDVFNSTQPGIVPMSGGGTTNFLRADGTWTAPGGSGSGTVNTGAINRLAYYASAGTAVDDLAAITASRALISDANGLPTHSSVTTTELGYVSGVTSGIQGQIDGKQDTITLGTTAQYFRGDLSLATFPTISGTNTGDVTLAGQNYLTIAGQVITANAVNLSGTHVTGTLAAARIAGTATDGFVATLVSGVPTWQASAGGYTDEQAQDAVGAMVNATLTYTDATPLLSINLGNANTWTADQSVPDEAYGAGWNGSMEVPTKNALYDKIETIAAGSSNWTLASGHISRSTGVVSVGGPKSTVNTSTNTGIFQVINDARDGDDYYPIQILTFGDATVSSSFETYRAGGTMASPTATLSGMPLLSWGFRGHDGTNATESAAAFIWRATEDFDTSGHGTSAQIEITPIGSLDRSLAVKWQDNGQTYFTNDLTPTMFRTSGLVNIDMSAPNAGLGFGLAIQNTTSNYSAILFGESTSNESYFQRAGSAVAGNFTNTSVAIANSSLLQAGPTKNQTLFFGGAPVIIQVGTTGSNTGARFDSAGLKLSAASALHTSTAASAMLEMVSTTQGLLPPRMNATQRDAISSPATGLIIYNTDVNIYNYYDGSAWQAFAGGGGGSNWTLASGNVYRSSGFVGAGTTSPTTTFHGEGAFPALTLNATSGFAYTRFQVSGTTTGVFGVASAADHLVTGSVDGDFIIRAGQPGVGNGNILFSVDATNIAMTLSTANDLILPGAHIVRDTTSASGFKMYNTSTNASNPLALFYPSTGTNSAPIIQASPKGTGFSSTFKAAIDIYNADKIADGTNMELLRFVAGGTDGYAIQSIKTGTGTVRPIDFQLGGVSSIKLFVNGSIGINGSTGTSGQVLTSAGTGAPPTWTTQSVPTLQQVLDAGSTLTSTETISVGTNALIVSGSAGAPNPAFHGNNTSSGIGVLGESSSGSGVTGVSNAGVGVYGSSTNGIALNGQTNVGIALQLAANHTSTNTAVTLITMQRSSSTTVANGLGLAIDMSLETSDGSLQVSSQIKSVWTDVTTASRTSALQFFGSNSGTVANRLTLAGSGNLTLETGQLIIATKFTPSSSTDATHPAGTLAVDDNFLYFKTGPTTWVRQAWSAF